MRPEIVHQFQRSFAIWTLLAAMFLFGVVSIAAAQDPETPRIRAIAPGVLTVIEPELEPSETLHVHDLVEIRADK